MEPLFESLYSTVKLTIRMKKLCYLFTLLVVAASCSTSKFDYHTAYKFSHQTYHKTTPKLEVKPVASLKPVSETFSTLPSDKALKEIGKSNAASNTVTLESYENASKAERKAIRKQVKQEYKELRKQVKQAKKAKEDATQDMVFNRKMMIGAIVLGAGILIAILVSGSGGAIGAVAIIVGIGLIAWGMIEQT